MRSTAPRLTWLGPQRLIVLALLLGPAACDIPGFDGPQVQGPPPVFYMQPEAYQQRRLFPDQELVFHTAWGWEERLETRALGIDWVAIAWWPPTTPWRTRWSSSQVIRVSRARATPCRSSCPRSPWARRSGISRSLPSSLA